MNKKFSNYMKKYWLSYLILIAVLCLKAVINSLSLDPDQQALYSFLLTFTPDPSLNQNGVISKLSAIFTSIIFVFFYADFLRSDFEIAYVYLFTRFEDQNKWLMRKISKLLLYCLLQIAVLEIILAIFVSIFWGRIDFFTSTKTSSSDFYH